MAGDGTSGAVDAPTVDVIIIELYSTFAEIKT
jgi:hypothetical protein